jgi:hypothetical protein
LIPGVDSHGQQLFTGAMSKFDDSSIQPPHALLAELTSARQDVLSVLERLGTWHSPATTDAMVALQAAANDLGLAESALSDLAKPAVDVPAPIAQPGSQPDHADVTWSGEAAAVIGLAELTIPYATGPAEEVDGWLRLLRREGAVGRALGELNFADEQLLGRAEPPERPRRLDAVNTIRAKASTLARQRGAASVTTVDILFAVDATHRWHLDRALYERDISRQELLALLPGRPAVTSGSRRAEPA